MPDEFRPDWCLAPAAHLREWMDETRITIPALALTGAGRDRQDEAAEMLQEVLDRKPLTGECAQILARGTGVSAGFWERLERNYREGLAAGRTDVTEEEGCG